MADSTLISEDQTSYLVSRSSRDIQGFCENYPLRRHKFEGEASKGSLQCRRDWTEYIGPIERWASCNPWEGHFGVVVLPFCKPERLAIISYIFEYAFLYDNVVESAAKCALNAHADNLALDETEYRTVRSITGTKQIQSKMLLELLSIDAPCAEVVIEAWKTMISTTTKQDKSRPFENLEDYVDYRIVDTGAPFVDMLMRFGMGILLTSEEDEIVSSIVKPCYAALGLANDYFSFDIEWEEFQQSEKATMTNAVWLFMQWHNIDVPGAKILVQQVTNRYEKEFQQNVASFVAGKGKDNIKLQTYLKAQSQQMPGNVAWSLRCPRYHPKLCEEASKMIYSTVQGLSIPPKRVKTPFQGPASTVRPRGHTDASVGSVSDDSSVWSAENTPSSRSSVSSASSHIEDLRPLSLGLEHLLGPSDYISSLPSKGVREAFIDALNVWLILPDHHARQLKCIAQTLHNASLMLDDIEDSSPLRRGQPATHMVFGQGQTINSANFLLIKAVDQVRQLEDEQCMQIFLEEMQNLFAGQSFDLYWTRNGKCPSYEKYMEMIRQKTGGLFRLLARLMTQKASALRHRNIALESLTVKLGEYFQIRDDYKNLTETYTGQKGFCEDIDEGKFSFPLIHALTSQPGDSELRALLQQSRSPGSIDVPTKQCILEHLHQAGSMEYTVKSLQGLMGEITGQIGLIENDTRCPNWILRLLVHRLAV